MSLKKSTTKNTAAKKDVVSTVRDPDKPVTLWKRIKPTLSIVNTLFSSCRSDTIDTTPRNVMVLCSGALFVREQTIAYSEGVALREPNNWNLFVVAMVGGGYELGGWCNTTGESAIGLTREHVAAMADKLGDVGAVVVSDSTDIKFGAEKVKFTQIGSVGKTLVSHTVNVKRFEKEVKKKETKKRKLVEEDTKKKKKQKTDKQTAKKPEREPNIDPVPQPSQTQQSIEQPQQNGVHAKSVVENINPTQKKRADVFEDITKLEIQTLVLGNIVELVRDQWKSLNQHQEPSRVCVDYFGKRVNGLC